MIKELVRPEIKISNQCLCVFLQKVHLDCSKVIRDRLCKIKLDLTRVEIHFEESYNIERSAQQVREVGYGREVTAILSDTFARS